LVHAKSKLKAYEQGMPRPSDAVILERTKSFCNEAIFTIALQHRRLRTPEPEDKVFIFRWHADLQFFIVALRRLRRAVELGAKVRHVSETLRAALTAFDDRLPGLAKMRNVSEHINDYLLGDGRTKDVQRGDLQVSAWDGTVFSWLGVELDIDAALVAAETLFEAVKQAARRHK
jgi:hypothetical protein